MKSNSSPEAQTFDKVLRAFEIRGINYADVLSRLRRLLAKGASPTELLVVLRRREAHERLPEYAGVEVLLLQAMERERERETETANTSVAPEIAEEAVVDLQLENSGKDFSAEAFEAALRVPEKTQAELRTLRLALAERDVALEELRQTLGVRDAELDAARIALEAEQHAARDVEQALAESTASEQAAREAARRAAEEAQADLQRLHEALAERTKEIAALEAELRAARAQQASVASRSRAAEVAAAFLEAQTQRVTPRGPEPAPRQPDFAPKGAPLRALGLIAVAVLLAGLAALYLQRPAPVPAPAKPAALPNAGTVIRDCPVCPEMKVLPGGRFKQGSPGGYASARVVHWVAIRRPIAMSTNPATVDDFRQFVAATGRDMHGCDIYDGGWKPRADASWDRPGFSQTGDDPVTCVSWDDAEAYAKWLSTRTGHRYRLPSASEWEYAARAGTETPSPWAADDRSACANANVADASARHRYPGWTVFPCDDGYVYTSPAGVFKPSPFGLNDMLGNVLQWTEDCWHDTYVGAPIDGSAWLDGDCSRHEIRGASWFSTPSHVRVDYRDRFPSDYRTSSVGIRLVRELGP